LFNRSKKKSPNDDVLSKAFELLANKPFPLEEYLEYPPAQRRELFFDVCS